jgi:F-type H+-transporting ATPase subunit delta
MSATAVARRYADALADVALERNAVDQIEGELRGFAELVRSSAELQQLFASPIISQANKSKVLEALIARLKPGELTANLLRTLLRNHRLQHVREVYEQFGRVLNQRRGVVVAKVTSAAPITDSERARLDSKLRSLTGKHVEFEFETDPSLIGGVITRVGSVVYDGSVRTQLQQIKQKLKAGE